MDQASISPGPPHHVTTVHMHAIYSQTQYNTYTKMNRKHCKAEGKLVLITNRKSYISFPLVPKWMTLNDLERRNGPYFGLFH